jgi:hypothetical protein
MEQSRKKKLDHFYTLCPVSESILDVGVSRDTREKGKGAPSMNFFLKTFRYKSENYTGLGVQDLSGMDKLYPGKRFVQYPGGRLPFKDNEFKWVFSNAVIEHVGDENPQVQFVKEMTRVGENVFFTTPNKYFPVDSHTDVFFLHWNNRLFYNWCKKHAPRRTKGNIYLFSRQRLESTMIQAKTKSYQIYKNRFLGMTMTFTIVCKQ